MNIPTPLLIITIIIIIWFYVFTYAHPNFESEKLNTLLLSKKFKTGDLILFKAVDNFNAPLIASYYGHIGIVFVYPDDPEQIPYIFEAANPVGFTLEDHHNPKGIYAGSLENRIKKYKGYCFYKELRYPIKKNVCEDFEDFIEYCVENMEYDEKVFSSGTRKLVFNERLNNKTNCGELAFLSLIKLGLINIDEYEKNTFHHLRWMCSITDLEDNNYYEEPVKILCDPF
jgi:hypothetical protein